jgi:diguanylate cyclase (GGDEF)-like protein
VAILVLAGFLGTSHFAATRAVEESARDAELVSMAGRQSMLSQRILFYTSNFENTGQEMHRVRAIAAVELMAESQQALANDPMLENEPELAKDVIELYGGAGQLNQRVQQFTVLALRVLQDDSVGIAELLAFDRDALLADLDRAVLEFEEIADAHSIGLREIQHWSLIAAIAVLFMEALFIFIPAQISVTSSLRKLEHQTEVLGVSRIRALERNRELERLKKQVEYDAKHDALTGLPNRRALNEMIAKLKKDTKDTHASISVMHIDLDRFKAINDTLGHAAGDHVLKHVARRLRQCARKKDIVARVGGDEFVLLPTLNTSRANLEALAERIIDALRQPVPYNENICHFGASIGIGIGISSSLSETETAADLLVQADIALYRAKELGRGRYEFFSEELAQEVEKAKRVADELLYAFDRDEFLVHYQPQLDAKTGAIVGSEALARWQHPVRGLQTAECFKSALHSLGLTSELDRLVLEAVERDIVAATRAGVKLPRVAINVSGQSLMKDSYMEALENLEVPASAISLELSETIYFDGEMEDVLPRIERLRAHGFDIEIDDFGTGHASILCLQKLRPARLKIAREVLLEVEESADAQRLVRSIAQIGKAYNAEIVAEGVETVAAGQILSSLGCDTLQGFALGQPNALPAYLAALAASQLRQAAKTAKQEAPVHVLTQQMRA